MRLVWRDVLVSEGMPPIFTSLTMAETAELERLAKGKRVLDIGTAFGYSAIVMGLAGATDVYTVDPHVTHNSLQEFSANVLRHNINGLVYTCVGTSQEVLPTLPLHYFDMVFVDGDHTLDGVRHDRDWALKLVKPYGSVIAFHDYDEDTCPGIKPALDEWPYKRSHLIDTLAVYSDVRPAL